MTALSGAKSAKEILSLAVLASVFFIFLGTRGLTEPDEGRYAELGREMVASGDWLTPHLNGFEHFQKPPIIYWLTASSFTIFGMNEWAARLPSTLAALGIVALTAWMAGELFGPGARKTAALVLASSFLFFILARFLTPDMTMAFFITAAVACLVAIYRGGSGLWRWGFFAAMGLGFLTKGPMALVIPISAALALRYALRREKLTLSLPWGRGLLLTFGIGLSWFVVMTILHPYLLDYFLRYELLNRVASHTHGRAQPFWFFFPVLTAAFLPWTFFVPVILRDAWRQHRTGDRISPQGWLLLGWLVPGFVLISVSGSKLITYVLPLLPACALIVTGWWQKKAYSTRPIFWISGASLFLLLVVAYQANRLNSHFGRQASVRSLAEQIQKQSGANEATIFACNVRCHGLEFYLQKTVAVTISEADIVLPVTLLQQRRLFESPAQCAEKMSQEKKAYGVVRMPDFQRHFPEEKWEILAQAGDFLLIGRRAASD